jgi:DNA-binding response OmpR family regulator
MKKILFVEDEPNLQKTIGEILRQKSYKIFGAFDGVAGIEMVEKENPDLILLDLILPKKDGFEVLKELKANEKFKNIPVIILTNLEGTGDVEKALDLGATTYLVKANYKLEDIVEKIEGILK